MESPEEFTHVPQLTQVTDAYQEIIAHNREHTGIGNAIFSMMMASAESGDVISDEVNISDTDVEKVKPSFSEKLDSTVTQGDMNAELQDIFHSETFLRIGIKIAPLGGQVVSGDGQKAASTELVPMVENTELFVEFLSTQEPEAFEAREENLELISGTVKNLQRTIFECFKKTQEGESDADKAMKREFGENALRTFIAIDEQYQRLGLREPSIYSGYLQVENSGMLDDTYKNRSKAEGYLRSYKELENYVKYWGDDVLEEYIQIGPLDRLAESKAWAIDGLNDKFNKEVDEIVQLIGPEKTTNLGIEAARAELSGINRALTQIDDPENWMNAVPGSRELFERNLLRIQNVTGDI
jgi:hypothetical protein